MYRRTRGGGAEYEFVLKDEADAESEEAVEQETLA